MDIERLEATYASEVTIATQTFFAWKAINKIASKDPAVRAGINQQALVWNVTLHSLQTTFFIALGRLFDEDDRALSVNNYLSKCQAHLDQFDAAHLRTRKIKTSQMRDLSWLDEYIAGICPPTQQDIRALKKKAKAFRSRYQLIYAPIRNKIMAHREMSTIDNIGPLFEGTLIVEMEEMLCFFNQLRQVIWEYLYNGRKSELSDYPFEEEAYVTEHVEKLLSRLKA